MNKKNGKLLKTENLPFLKSPYYLKIVWIKIPKVL
jgi:hypothetical protein